VLRRSGRRQGPRGRAEDDPGGGRRAWIGQPSEHAAGRQGGLPSGCGVLGRGRGLAGAVGARFRRCPMLLRRWACLGRKQHTPIRAALAEPILDGADAVRGPLDKYSTIP
jgi:hypothetical protein